MFGYLKPCLKALSPGQRALYNAHYCGLCRSLQRFGGIFAPLLTNFDQAFFSLLASCLRREEELVVDSFRCPPLPFAWKSYALQSSREEGWSAATTIQLVEAKLRDDCEDERRSRYRVFLSLLGPLAAKADAFRHSMTLSTGLCTKALEAQKHVEAGHGDSPEELAGPTAALIGSILAELATLADAAERAEEFRQGGEALGGFIYLWDAYDDYGSDMERGRFNGLKAAKEKCGTMSFLFPLLKERLERVKNFLSRLDLYKVMDLPSLVIARLEKEVRRAEKVERFREEGTLPLMGKKRLNILRPGFAGERGSCDCCDACACDSCCGGEACCCGDAACADCACCTCDCMSDCCCYTCCDACYNASYSCCCCWGSPDSRQNPPPPPWRRGKGKSAGQGDHPEPGAGDRQ